MKILVTGAAGYIGSNLSENLLNNGHTVVGIDNFNDYYDPKLKEFNLESFKDHEKFTLYRVDITDKKTLDQFFEKDGGYDAVVHLAAWAGVTYSVKHPSIYVLNNVDGTNNLAECALKDKTKVFIFASTSSIYGDNKTPFTEDMDTSKPNAPYPATKKAGEVLLYTYHKNFNMNATIFRFFNPIGPRLRPDMALPKLIRSTIYGYDFPIYQNPEESGRDYTYVGDIAQTIETACEKPLGYEIMNLGNSSPVSLVDLMNTVEKVTGKSIKKVEKPMPGQMQITYANIDKARDLLGYDPKTTLEEMVEIYYKWFLEQPEWYQKFKIE